MAILTRHFPPNNTVTQYEFLTQWPPFGPVERVWYFHELIKVLPSYELALSWQKQ
jgi:hypothetical protein